MNWERRLSQVLSLVAFILVPALIKLSPLSLLSKSLMILPFFTILSAIIFSRTFCGWICPLGTSIEFLDKFSFNLDFPLSKKFRFYLLAFLISSSIIAVPIFWFFAPLTIFKRFIVNLKTGEFFFLSFFFIIVLEICFGNRTWCKKLCPLGGLLSLIAKFGVLDKKIQESCQACGVCSRACPMGAIQGGEIKKTDCIFCGKCEEVCPAEAIETGFNLKEEEVDLERRNLLKVGGALVLPLLLPFRVKAKEGKRLPGALPEKKFVESCIRCGNCVLSCPEGIIKFKKKPGEDFLTPYIDFEEGYCTGCMKCVKNCPVSALKGIRPEEMKLGTAKINKEKCLTWSQEKPCLICYKKCPYGAIELKNGKPVINEGKCKGCGKCQYLCPVGAIEIKSKVVRK